MRYAVHEGRSGKVFLTNRAAAETLHQLQTGQFDDATADKDALQQVYGLVENMRAVTLAELTAKPPFNPLFIRWAGIDLGRYEGLLGRMAAFTAPLCWPVLCFLVLGCLALGLISEWAIMDSASQAISLQGIATFALLSPFLKLPHELGHAMVTRAYNVPLRNAGIVFVGLFPLPFVDTSMADICANRNQRIKISLAGIFVDLLIAMSAFIAWYFVDGTFLKTIFVNVFVFSSLNSLLFNGNPLMRLDGYFAFSDWIGHRNLSSAAAGIFKDARQWVMTFGADGIWPQDRMGRMYLYYGLGSALYKLNILATVLWLTLPRFFGGGVVLALWAGYAMFFSPLLNKPATHPVKQKKGRAIMRRKALFMAAMIAGLGGCLFIPLPFRVTVPVALDTNGVYAIQTQEAGVLTQIAPAGDVAVGQALFTLENATVAQDIAVARERLDLARLQREAVLQSDQTQARVATAQLEGPQKELDVLLERQQALVQEAGTAGVFYPDVAAREGLYFAEGSRLGYLLDADTPAVVIGQFPETRIARLRQGNPRYALWNAGEIVPHERITDVSLIQVNQLSAETGQRSYQLIAKIDLPADQLHGRQQFLKLTLEKAPVHEHLYDIFSNLRRSYLNARIGEGG